MIATIIVLLLLAGNVVLNYVKDGKPKKYPNYSFKHSLFGVAIWLVLLYFMGVFDNF